MANSPSALLGIPVHSCCRWASHKITTSALVGGHIKPDWRGRKGGTLWKKGILVTLTVAWVLAPEGWFVLSQTDSTPMWSSAIVAHLLQGLTHSSLWGARHNRKGCPSCRAYCIFMPFFIKEEFPITDLLLSECYVYFSHRSLKTAALKNPRRSAFSERLKRSPSGTVH